MNSPRNATLGEEIYRDIDNNEYLNELYSNILYNYSIKVLGKNAPPKDICLEDALRFADILSKSAYMDNSEKHKSWAQEIIALLGALYPDEQIVKDYAASVLTSIGNFRGLQLISSNSQHKTFLDELFATFEMEYLAIPYQENKYFFHSQKEIYERLDDETFSYSGPTSMGKSLLMRMFIKDKIVRGQGGNFAILVPTKALISEISSSIIQDLNTLLSEKDYKVVNSAGALALQEEHNFIFVLTPERMLYLLISNPTIDLDYLFVDEAHKISAHDGRSAFYYKVVDMLSQKAHKPHFLFASPNIPNPDEYLKLIPDLQKAKDKALATSYSPVSQLKFMVDLVGGSIRIYNEHSSSFLDIAYVNRNTRAADFIKHVCSLKPEQQSLVYFSSKDSTIDMARQFAVNMPIKNDPELEKLSKEIKSEIHDTYYLAELIRRGVAYHVGYLPTYIRNAIEKCYREKKISIIFCTSTLVEGVNLPADNLFIMSYRNGIHTMQPVDFRNLIGRVGRIEYNLYGNVFVIREKDSTKVETYVELLTAEIPEQHISLVTSLTKPQKKLIVSTLEEGNIKFPRHPANQSEDSYSLMRKFGLILLRDITKHRNSPVKAAFADFLTPEIEQKIISNFINDDVKAKPDDDITVSVDQSESLYTAIANGLEYPARLGDKFDYEAIVSFLNRLCRIFNWDDYERQTLGFISKDGKHSMLRWYAVILAQWMEGNGLNSIIVDAIRNKEQYNGTVKIHGDYFEYNGTQQHKNAVIAETLSTIDKVILFSIANYFLKFSTEYKKQKGVEVFDNDWYEFVEYGSTNKLTILLQRNGFSRETSEYIKQNKAKYVVDTPNGPKLKMTLLACPKESVKNEVQDIQFNVPELFVEVNNF